MIIRKLYIVSVVFAFLGLDACKISYSFTGASIPPEMKTFTVKNIQNQGMTCSPMIAFQFREELQDKIQSQTSLKLVNKKGDAVFEGVITDCNLRQLAVQGDNMAARNRYTIKVKIKYTNEIDPEQNFDASFSRYEDFSSEQNFNDVENELIDELIDQLSEDIFNKAFVNW